MSIETNNTNTSDPSVDPASPYEHNRAHEGVAVFDHAGELVQLFADGEHWNDNPWRPPVPYQVDE